MTMSTAVGRGKRAAGRLPREAARAVGTVWTARLAGGPRPFLPVRPDALPERGWWGWLFPDPALDGGDALLKEAGVSAAGRQAPCYLLVPLDRLSAV